MNCYSTKKKITWNRSTITLAPERGCCRWPAGPTAAATCWWTRVVWVVAVAADIRCPLATVTRQLLACWWWQWLSRCSSSIGIPTSMRPGNKPFSGAVSRWWPRWWLSLTLLGGVWRLKLTLSICRLGWSLLFRFAALRRYLALRVKPGIKKRRLNPHLHLSYSLSYYQRGKFLSEGLRILARILPRILEGMVACKSLSLL